MRVDVALPSVLQTQIVHAQDLVKDVLDICVPLTTTTAAASPSST